MNASQLKATDSLEAWLSYLENSHFKPIDMGLVRIQKVASTLDLLSPAPYVITVAGTNGKGSTCRLLEIALLKAGYRVGVYSSPHLIRYNERVRIQGEMLPDEMHTASFAHIEQGKCESLTYFEFSTLSALHLFKQAQLDVVILEVGLGGRLDATNIISPNLAVITSIDIDHTAFLGDNREAIGFEKAGIFRPQITAVIGEPDCPQRILEHAQQLGTTLFRRGVDWQFSLESDRLHWQSSQQNWADLPLPKLPLPNVATALAVLSQIPFEVSEQNVREAVAEAQLTARFQPLTEQAFAKFSQNTPLAQVILDVGHNPHAARYLADRLQALKQPNQKIYALFAVLADKDLAGIVEPLVGLIDEWHCAGLSGLRGQSGEQVAQKLATKLPAAQISSYPDVATASQSLFTQAQEQDWILVFGSFHTVGDFLTYIEQ